MAKPSTLRKFFCTVWLIITGLASAFNELGLILSSLYLYTLLTKPFPVDSFGTPGRALIMMGIFYIFTVLWVLGFISALRKLKED